MHDETSFMATFGIGQHGGHKHKIHKSLLICRKILIFGQWITSTNAIIYDHYLVTISCLVIEVLFAVTKKYLVIEDYSFYEIYKFGHSS
jgi:hypothetical protein